MTERQIVLDTETTGMPAADGHRLVEIGAVEMIERRVTGRTFHCYLNPERPVDEGAFNVHGLSDAFLADKPKFADVVDEFLAFIEGAELIIHNAEFDVGFIDAELARLANGGRLADVAGSVTDSLAIARKKHPGQRNSLDALCRRYNIDNSARTLHGALLDSEILADVYLALTGGQKTLGFDSEQGQGDEHQQLASIIRLSADRPPLRVINANDEERAAHASWLMTLGKEGKPAPWPRE
ncbi:MAG: DNA polymerase III subunit epsilon [Halothiobacillus sp. 14-56-357]|jgi:DNA polymerase-3 subunit epsilon|uniref:DNA polymerase III subunit epsilon n=1 Tax=Halothiobacillus sp. 15-55-196 TaxID=1970382 RepID=UPI000BD9A57A|nr:DNA polymerase III subunit epsilon [Halothiobacillus sp. 15-55-196]OZB36749.1 MAG: DNA polymerase III subunit epsilon [Halothiobacillus sp. 15-55-196]OZB57044.1 MAG: DNA polymerase III subunit epsilon [Halothiobacillus sp. 14-56-357]